MKNIAAAVLGLLALGSCYKAGPVAESSRFITVEARIGDMTKASYEGNKTAFEAGDSLSLFAWTGDKTAIPAKLVVDNVTNTLGADGKWTPKTQMLWADVDIQHYFLAVAPAREVASFTADPYTVDNTDYEKSDLLVARQLSGLTSAQNPVSLTFDHAMAKLYVNMNFRNQWDAAPEVAACAATAAGSCTIDYLAQTVTAGEPSAVSLAAKDAATGYARSFSGIMIPQSGFRTITLTIEGKAYTYTHTEDIPLEAGKYTTVNLIVGRNKIEVGEVSINDWAEGTTLSGGQALQ